MIAEIKSIEKPKHIIFNGALYELIDANVPTVSETVIYSNNPLYGGAVPCVEPYRFTCGVEERKEEMTTEEAISLIKQDLSEHSKELLAQYTERNV